MAPALTALLWDVDGTLAETEFEGHRLAFNHSFADAGLPWRWDRPTYARLLAVSGGQERITSFLQQVEGRTPEPGRVEELQRRKQAHYIDLVRQGRLALRPGVGRLVRAAAAASESGSRALATCARPSRRAHHAVASTPSPPARPIRTIHGSDSRSVPSRICVQARQGSPRAGFVASKKPPVTNQRPVLP